MLAKGRRVVVRPTQEADREGVAVAGPAVEAAAEDQEAGVPFGVTVTETPEGGEILGLQEAVHAPVAVVLAVLAVGAAEGDPLRPAAFEEAAVAARHVGADAVEAPEEVGAPTLLLRRDLAGVGVRRADALAQTQVGVRVQVVAVLAVHAVVAAPPEVGDAGAGAGEAVGPVAAAGHAGGPPGHAKAAAVKVLPKEGAAPGAAPVTAAMDVTRVPVAEA